MNATPERFSRGVLRQIQNTDAVLYLSSASAWEIAIKYALGKLTLPEPPSRYVPDRLRLTRTSPLPVSIEHALRVADLPAHHRDPFDRLLVAQAQVERVPILTADVGLGRYDVDIIEA
jgi:PIN domain nuclease of toxin-antitoxin system